MSLKVEIEKRAGDFSLSLSFETDSGCMGILGASGCGKSMTLRCIAGIETPDRGRILLHDRILFDSEKHVNLPPQERRVGYLFQNYALFPRMTVRKNVEAGLKGMPETDRRKVSGQWLKAFRLEDLADRYPGQLSGGQQQRVALARTLACEPDVLMLDEPFSALDTYLKEQMHFELQKALQKYPGPVLMVTHSRDEIYRFCESVVIMDEGRKIDSGGTRELFRNPGTLTAARLSGCKNFSAARKTGRYRLYAEDWKMELTTALPVPEDVRAVGIRAHDFVPAAERDAENCFCAEAVDCSEGPFEASVRMAVGGNSPEEEEKLVWWKLETGLWEKKYRPAFPERFTVLPEKVMPLR